MSHWPHRLTPLDRFLGLFTQLRPGEGRSVAIFFSYALLMMLSYYILKTIREPLLLTGNSAEAKSYAYAVTALVLLLVIPLYGFLFRHTNRKQLTRYVTGFFLACLLVFYLLGRSGVNIGFAYYVFVGMFSVLITAQFWGFAADSFNTKSGQRLFPLIMVGATLGGLAAPALSGFLFGRIGPWPLMLIAMAFLALTIPCVGWGQNAIPPGSHNHEAPADEPRHGGFFSGLSLVFSDRYLLLLALLIVLLNWVNTTGEYILAELVVGYADDLSSSDPQLNKSDIIAGFYGSFFSIVNLLTLLLQVFVVARVIRWIGVKGAILVLPVIAFIGYGMVVFIPVFSIIRVVKILENSTDYSLMNTSRHALYLPMSPAKKYEGKTTIEGFFWRFGDLAQAAAIYVGLHRFNFDLGDFALLNMCLALVWLAVAIAVSRRFNTIEQEVSGNLPPRLVHDIADYRIASGLEFSFQLPRDTFIDPDAGDVLSFTACLDSHKELPEWLYFDAETLAFSGRAPEQDDAVIYLIVRATDFDGAWAEGKMKIMIE